jgi:hypothetical protein
MIGLLFIVCLLTDGNNDNPIIIRPHIVFTDERQRQPNHNTTTYCVYWRTTTTTTQSQYDHILCLLTNDKNDNPIIIRPHIVFTDDDNNDNPIIIRLIGLSLSSVSKHNMWSHYDWVVVVFVSKQNMWLYYDWVVVVDVGHIVLTDGRQQRQPNHNTTTYCVYWRMTTTTTQT